MTKKEYQELTDNCTFVRRYLQFYSKEDFMKHSEFIKEAYNDLDNIGKEVYMYYVFSKRYIRYKELCKIWDWLNNYADTPM